MPQQAIKHVQATLAWSFLPLLAIGITALTVLLFTITDNLHRNALKACRTSNVTRVDSNVHLRQPLRTIGMQAALVLRQAAVAERQQGLLKEAAAAARVAAAFEGAAAKVHDLPPLNCEKLNGG